MCVLPVGTGLAMIRLQVQRPESNILCAIVHPKWPLNTHLNPLSSTFIVKTRQNLIWWWGKVSFIHIKSFHSWICDSVLAVQIEQWLLSHGCWPFHSSICVCGGMDRNASFLLDHTDPHGSVDGCISKDVLGNCSLEWDAWRERERLQMCRR